MARYRRRRRFYRRRRRGVVKAFRRFARKLGRYSKIAQTLRTGGWPRLNPGKPERKYKDTTIAVNTFQAFPAVAPAVGYILLNDIAQGFSETTRVGNKITIKSIQWVISCYVNGACGRATTIPVDFKIFIDTQANGANPGATDLETANLPTLLNLANRKRFIVIKHKIMTFAPQLGGASVAAHPSTMTWKGYKRMNLDVIYKSAGAGIADIATNSLFLAWIGLPIDNDVNKSGFTYAFRIRYTDS